MKRRRRLIRRSACRPKKRHPAETCKYERYYEQKKEYSEFCAGAGWISVRRSLQINENANHLIHMRPDRTETEKNPPGMVSINAYKYNTCYISTDHLFDYNILYGE